jgi:hypothetical protein
MVYAGIQDNPSKHKHMIDVKVEEKLKLIVTENDFPPAEKAAISSVLKEEQVLGGDDTVLQQIYDQLPSIVAKRVKKMVPEGFTVGELQFTFSLEGKIFGSGIGGDVAVTLKPIGRKENPPGSFKA